VSRIVELLRERVSEDLESSVLLEKAEELAAYIMTRLLKVATVFFQGRRGSSF
jgi:hypothetical protein